MENKITVTIITLNEEKNIEKAVRNANLIADEVIVVDSGSQDNTVKIARGMGAKIFERKFDDFAAQKNFAASKANCEWIFSLDADEEISKSLANEIKTAIADTNKKGFLVPRRNFILGGEIKHSRWSPDAHIWLWRKGFGTWSGKVHEEVVVKGDIGLLTNGKIHHQDESISEFLDSLNTYTQFEAKSLYEKRVKFTIFKLLYFPLRSFIGRYIYKKGFQDGWRGFVLCSLRAIYHVVVWLKVLELEKR